MRANSLIRAVLRTPRLTGRFTDGVHGSLGQGVRHGGRCTARLSGEFSDLLYTSKSPSVSFGFTKYMARRPDVDRVNILYQEVCDHESTIAYDIEF